MQKQNETFRASEPFWANAVVGNNGNPQALEYATGFAAAANVLIKNVIADRGMKLHVDDFIYPICFNMRHSVELFLKAVAEQLKTLAGHRRQTLDFDGNNSHDLGLIWDFVKVRAPAIDRRFQELVDALGPYIDDIAAVDATGQVFRYPYSTESTKHLVEVSNINVIVLYKRFHALQDMLESLYRLGDLLVSEYAWGTYTSKLSRDDLMAIALSFPAKSDWGTDAFTVQKQHVRDVFGLSNKDFSNALNVIQQNYEMAALVGIPLGLQYVDDRLLRDFFEFWGQLHDLDDLRNPPAPQIREFDHELMFEGIMRDAEVRKACWEKMSAYVTAGHVAELGALFYFAREMRYSETFVQIRTMELSELQADKTLEHQRWKEALDGLLSKTNAVKNILNSLNFLCQKVTVAMLLEHLQLRDAAPRLLEHSVVNLWLSHRLGGKAMVTERGE